MSDPIFGETVSPSRTYLEARSEMDATRKAVRYGQGIGAEATEFPDWQDDDALEKLARMVSDVGGLTSGGIISNTLAKGVLRLLAEKRNER